MGRGLGLRMDQGLRFFVPVCIASSSDEFSPPLYGGTTSFPCNAPASLVSFGVFSGLGCAGVGVSTGDRWLLLAAALNVRLL